ncbi:hypothetical protein EDD30_6776 [Couchioplanes caeruleus]|uniref:Uncharacterized protein n=1 Tax=Couchioplanes caeruleus TaxID=56438 RepID=A0A3N1GTZ3_9ACTN|nr:hypothetical protein EDD30_6776 [Couchioplanes caeruleus]
MPSAEAVKAADTLLLVLWINSGITTHTLDREPRWRKPRRKPAAGATR